jgi:ATP-binding cassette subfamily G (WHITE) protein 1/ATP-binding cassette subfamily G (WHITE) protein 2
LLTPIIFFSGFTINLESIPVYFSWIPYISPIKYGFSSLIQLEYTGLDLFCEPSQLVRIPGGAPICPITHGSQVLENLQMTEEEVGTTEEAVLIMAGLYVGFLFLSFLGLAASTGDLKRQCRR